MKDIEIFIEKLVHGGKGLGYFEGIPVFVWNALPKEKVKININRKKKDFIEGTVTKVLEPSEHRITNKEKHFMSCSPWQIMDFDYENYWKEEITRETFKKLAGLEIGGSKIITDQKEYGYRNKIEYSFFIDENEKLRLAFFKRGSKGLNPIETCDLAKEGINKAAIKILNHLIENKVSRWDLKTLILRENQKGEVLAALFVKKEDFSLDDIPLDETLVGFKIYYSNPKSPASVATRLLKESGSEILTDTILNKEFAYGVLSFFQVNIPLYEKVLIKIKENVSGDHIVDFYSGTGSIGISLEDAVKSAVLVESDEESGNYAKKNIIKNGLKNFEVHIEPAEKMLEEIKKEKTIIFDPPRSGLHPKVTEKVLEVLPKKIIYLSCDIATQARDIGVLKERYKIVYNQIYNFFPRTPHIESLIVLELK